MNLDQITTTIADAVASVPDIVWAAAVATVVLALLWTAARAIRRVTTPAADLLTYLAAGIATGVSAQGMWHFFEVVFPTVPVALRVALFAFIEIGVLASAVRARRSMRESAERAKTDPSVRPSAGIDGTAVWALTGLTAVLSSLEADSQPEFIFRLAAPFVAAWLWERGMAIERQRITGRARINWRLTPERIMVRIGLAEASDRTASEVDAHRRLTRVALRAKQLRTLRETGAVGWRVRRALARLDRAMDQAVAHTNLVEDPARQQRLLAQLGALYGTARLAELDPAAPWEQHLAIEAVRGEAEGADEVRTAVEDVRAALDEVRTEVESVRTALARTEARTEDVRTELVSVREELARTEEAVRGALRTHIAVRAASVRPSSSAVRTARRTESRTDARTPMSRQDLVDYIRRQMTDTDAEWRPDYDELERLSGRKRSACEKAVRDARTLGPYGPYGAADQPRTDEPRTDEPRTDEPRTDEPRTDEPRTDEPRTDEPRTDATPVEVAA